MMRPCAVGLPGPRRCSGDLHHDSTTTRDYTADLAHSLHVYSPRRPSAKRCSVEIWIDDGFDPQPAPPVPARPMPPAARPKAPRRDAVLSEPTQRDTGEPTADGALRPRRRRVSALLAEKRMASANKQSGLPDVPKDPSRRTIYVPSDDTVAMSVHPRYSRSAHRSPSPDIGLDLVVLSRDEPQALQPALKQTRPAAKSLAAAPKRVPLQKSPRPLQAVSCVEDVLGKSLGKENIPPGMSLKAAKKPSRGAEPEPIRKTRPATSAPTDVPAARTSATRKRTSPDSFGSPSKALRSTKAATRSRPSGQEPISKRQTRASTSISSSLLSVVKSPPQVLRRSRVAKLPSKLDAPRRNRSLQRPNKSPALVDGLDKIELYEENWLGHQETSVTQLVNKIFDDMHLPSKDQGQEDRILRKSLLAAYQNPQILPLHKKIQASLTCGSLAIPKDLLVQTVRIKDDVGLRRSYLDLFLNTYEPSLLRAAAEVVVGRECRVPARASSRPNDLETGQRQRRAEKKAIENFLDAFFIRNEDAARAKASFGSIASIARGHEKVDDFGSQDWSWHRTTLRSFMLILLLDMTKTKDIISHPLFQTSSSFKSSRAVLQQLGSILLPSLGDLTRPLGHLAYSLHYVQYPLQEFDYHVDNLATDLRDGVILTRAVELLLYPPTSAPYHQEATVSMPTGDMLVSYPKPGDKVSWILSQHLKFPCVSRAQKQYNVQIALSALEAAGQTLGEFAAEDIVDGHREKTLGLLWSLVGKRGLEVLVDWTELEKETQRYRFRYYQTKADEDRDAHTQDESELAAMHGLERYTALLRGWAHSIARCRGLQAANLTTSFADGRVLEAIADEYIACFPTSPLAAAPSASGLPAKLQLVGCSAAFVSLFASSSGRFNNPIPSKDFTTMVLAFLASRLLPTRRAHHAAATLQRCFRKRMLRREVSKRALLMRLASHCAAVVQTRERVVGAAIVLQRAWRCVLDARIRSFVDDVTGFQARARGWAVRSRLPKGSKRKGGSVRKPGRIRGGW